MRKLIRKIVEILDGTPSVYGERQQGQSILEMVFIIPLLAILIIGIAEIGWLANNYLILQEVSKVGARRGTVLPSDIGPVSWDLNADLRNSVLLPRAWTGNDPIEAGWTAGGTPEEQASFGQRDWDRLLIRVECDEGALRSDTIGTGQLRRSFYNEIMCIMFDSLDPLVLDQDNGIDDMIISVFAVQTIHNDAAGDYDFESGYSPDIAIDEYEAGYIPVVVGRYPILANECNMQGNPEEDGVTDATRNDVERDPFDYINDNQLTFTTGPDPVPLELATLTSGGWTSLGYDDGAEFQRGFSLYGNHMVEEDGIFCYGSDWTVQDIQDQISVPQFEFTASEAADPQIANDDTGRHLPGQGVVLVEIYWQHRLLLNLPVFSPVMQALGDDRTTIYVWSMFPVPTAEPNINFP